MVAFSQYFSRNDLVFDDTGKLGVPPGARCVSASNQFEGSESLCDSAKTSVTTIKMRGSFESQKQLSATGILSAMRHAQRAGEMLPSVGSIAFAFNLVSRTIAASLFAVGIDLKTSGLCHKVFNHAMEYLVGIPS